MKNRLHKIISLLLAVCMLAAAGLAFAEGAPALDGVHDQSVMAGTEFDALAGVTATDAAGADLTDMIVIESTPALDFKNGKATPENPGDYELVYSVTDANGGTAEDYATLTVTKNTGEETVYRTFDFSTAAGPENHGWEAKIGEAAEAKAEMKEDLCPYPGKERKGGGLGDLRWCVQCGDRAGNRAPGTELHFRRGRQRGAAVQPGQDYPEPGQRGRHHAGRFQGDH